MPVAATLGLASDTVWIPMQEDVRPLHFIGSLTNCCGDRVSAHVINRLYVEEIARTQTRRHPV